MINFGCGIRRVSGWRGTLLTYRVELENCKAHGQRERGGSGRGGGGGGMTIATRRAASLVIKERNRTAGICSILPAAGGGSAVEVGILTRVLPL